MKYIVEMVNKTLLFKIKKFESHDKNYIRFLKKELYVVLDQYRKQETKLEQTHVSAIPEQRTRWLFRIHKTRINGLVTLIKPIVRASYKRGT